LVLYKDAIPTRSSLSRVVKVLCVGPRHDSPQPRATTLGPQQRLTPPHGWVRSRNVSRESCRPQGLNSESRPPWESVEPLDIQSRPPRLVQDLHVCKSDPWNGIRTPPPEWGPGRPQWGPKVPGQNILVPWSGPRRGSGADTCPDLIWLSRTLLLPAQTETRCCHVAYYARY
jgi:hypothetical protein